MIAAGFYKPNTYTGSSFDFASDNFNYCGRKIADTVIRAGMAPFYAIAQQQVDSQKTLNGPMNSVRVMLAKSTKNFSDYMSLQYLKFNSVFFNITKIYSHFQFGLKRMNGIMIAGIYMVLSGFIFIGNMIQFGSMAIKIFLGILTGLMIILFPILSPLAALIATVTAIVSGTVIGIVSSVESQLCCDPDALVKMADGTQKPLGSICVGDILLPEEKNTENRVEGILFVDGSKTALVSIDGVRMSGSHSVQYKTEWILAKDHPKAVAVSTTLPHLICLNTSCHTVPLVGLTKTVSVGDWEEVSTYQGRQAWIDWVHIKLNGAYTNVPRYPDSIPLVSPSIHVWKEDVGKVPIDTIQLGDRILCGKGYTRVLSIYTGQLHVNQSPSTPEWISDGVWTLQRSYWTTPYAGVKHVKNGKYLLNGLHLITEDEMFKIERNGKEVLIRDFTEVGLSSIEQSYTMINLFMNKK